MINRILSRPESAWALNFARKDLKHAGEICDIRKDAHFKANLWRAGEIDLPVEDRCGFEELLLSATSMEQRLGMFLMPEFLPHLRALDLGESMNPANGEDLRKVEVEYEDLRQKLIDSGVIDAEMSRDESGRTVHIDHLSMDALLGTRNRKLFTFVENGVRVSAHKQTSFLVSPAALHAMSLKNGLAAPTDPNNYGYLHAPVVEAIEAAIDTHDPSVYPVRTHFFVKTS